MVDDLFAIVIIAVFFTSDLHVAPLLLAGLPWPVFTVLVQRRIRSWWLLLPLATTTWALVHASGVHATISAGVAVPVFAFFAAGVTVGGLSGLRSSLTDPVAVGIVVGLVAGKAIGIVGAAYLMAPVDQSRVG